MIEIPKTVQFRKERVYFGTVLESEKSESAA